MVQDQFLIQPAATLTPFSWFYPRKNGKILFHLLTQGIWRRNSWSTRGCERGRKREKNRERFKQDAGRKEGLISCKGVATHWRRLMFVLALQSTEWIAGKTLKRLPDNARYTSVKTSIAINKSFSIILTERCGLFTNIIRTHGKAWVSEKSGLVATRRKT